MTDDKESYQRNTQGHIANGPDLMSTQWSRSRDLGRSMGLIRGAERPHGALGKEKPGELKQPQLALSVHTRRPLLAPLIFLNSPDMS